MKTTTFGKFLMMVKTGAYDTTKIKVNDNDDKGEAIINALVGLVYSIDKESEEERKVLAFKLKVATSILRHEVKLGKTKLLYGGDVPKIKQSITEFNRTELLEWIREIYTGVVFHKRLKR